MRRDPGWGGEEEEEEEEGVKNGERVWVREWEVG